jgi:hypothetical protein
MKLMTKDGQPLRSGNANPKWNRSARVYFYRTFNGRAEIRIFRQVQDSKTRRWKVTGKAGIYHGSAEAIAALIKMVSEWDKESQTSRRQTPNFRPIDDER